MPRKKHLTTPSRRQSGESCCLNISNWSAFYSYASLVVTQVLMQFFKFLNFLMQYSVKPLYIEPICPAISLPIIHLASIQASNLSSILSSVLIRILFFIHEVSPSYPRPIYNTIKVIVRTHAKSPAVCSLQWQHPRSHLHISRTKISITCRKHISLWSLKRS